MKIATWNINSVRARIENVVEWLRSAEPDVLLLQEIKCETNAFPAFELQALGYQAAVVGQKSYNGVALLSRLPMTNVIEHLPGAVDDSQSRYIEATIGGVRIACAYLPNGNPINTDKFEYKLAWIRRLQTHLLETMAKEYPVILGGDLNIIAEPIDIYDINGWQQDALYHPRTRKAYWELLGLGLTDAYRTLHPGQAQAYTFWDYQGGAWPQDKGLRIDYFLLSPEAADKLVACEIDRAPRGKEKASDHTPLVLTIA